MITYKPFLKLLIDRNIRKTDVAKQVPLSSATLAKLNTNGYVALEVIDKLCAYLNCQPADLMEYIPDSPAEAAPKK